MKKRWQLIALIIVLVLAVIAAIFVINRSIHRQPKEIENIDEAIDEAVESEDEEFEYGSGIDFEEEAEGADISFAKKEVSDYYGTWKATSDQAIYLYGNIKLTINEDNTWNGIVVDEQENGTWTYDGTKMTLTSEFFNVTLSFTEDGTMVMQEDREEDGDLINTVLIKQE